MAKLHFKYGAMNSGKSDTLIKTAYNYTERGLRVFTIKPSIDTKSDRDIIARAGLTRTADAVVTGDTSILKLIRSETARNGNIDCILIDEAQFLTAKQVDELLELAKKDGISVIAYGLRADFLTHLFPGSARLLEVADNIEKLPTMCRCGSQAEFNTRMVDGEFTFEGDQVAIDGEGTVTYSSLCYNCYMAEK